MEVFEILQPGAFLVCPDEGYRRTADKLLGFMRQQFFDANEAVNLFVGFEPGEGSIYVQMEEHRPRRPLMDQAPDRGVFKAEDLIAQSLEAMKQHKRERWARGVAPLDLQAARQRICAQGFLYSVHMIHMLLKRLIDPMHGPAQLPDLARQLEDAFPNLKEVRDSTQHADERVVGRHWKGGKSLEIILQPVENDAVSAPGGVLGVANLIGNRYQTTTWDGRWAEVEVSYDSLRKLQGLLQAVLRAFSWSGPEVHFPTD